MSDKQPIPSSASPLSDGDLAVHLAGAAGRILINVRESGLFSAKALGKAGDHTANQFLVHGLRETRPDDGLLSEEMACDGARLAKSRVWIVDPVDGTREYGEARSDWAVHVGMAVDGQPVLGAVALPDHEGGTVLRSDQPRDVPPAPEKLRMVVSRTRPAKEAIAVAEKLDAELVPMGSAGAKAMAIILGQADIYLHSGGQYEWDSMAPVAVALAHGLHASRIDGSPLIYNQQNVYMPDLLICRREHARQVLELVAEMAGTVA